MGNKYPKRIRVFLIVMELVSILPIYLPWYYLPKNNNGRDGIWKILRSLYRTFYNVYIFLPNYKRFSR